MGRMKATSVLPAIAAAVFAAGCASSPPPGFDPELVPFTPLSVSSRNVLAEELKEPKIVVAAHLDVDMRSDPRFVVFRYTPVRFRTGAGSALSLHALAPEETFVSMSGLRDALRKRHEKGTLGILVSFDGVAAGTRDLDDREAAALSEVLSRNVQPMLEESEIPFSWIIPTSARLFPVLE